MRDRLLILLTAVALVLGAWAVWRAVTYRAAGVPATGVRDDALPADYPRQARALPAFHLVDEHGKPFDTGAPTGRPTILSFVFAHCKVMCPTLVDDTRRAAEELGPDGARLLWVTLDPERDTPETLPELAEAWQLPPGGHVLSGDPAEIGRMLDTLGVARVPDDVNDFVHPPMVFVLDGDGRLTYTFNGPPVDWIVEGVRRTAGG